MDDITTEAKKQRHLKTYVRTFSVQVEEGLVITSNPVKFLKYPSSSSSLVQMTFKVQLNWVQDIIVQLHIARATFYLRLLGAPEELLIVYKIPGCDTEQKHHLFLVN